jgi:two-component system cell cycle response regulator
MLPSILLVDDEKDILDYLAIILGVKYQVVTAQSGKEALEILAKEAVQLIICDIMMPEMDGLELCRKIKSNFEYSHIPIILLTAKNTIQSKVEGLELGADAYIDKPFSNEYLQAQIASLLLNRNAIREYFAASPLVHIKSIAHTKTDELFLEALHETIYRNIEDVDLDIDRLAKLLNMSRPTLFRKIKAISNITPGELIALIKLKRGAELLSEGQYKINEVSALLGYHFQSNFTRDFQKHFKMTPTEFVSTKLSTGSR